MICSYQVEGLRIRISRQIRVREGVLNDTLPFACVLRIHIPFSGTVVAQATSKHCLVALFRADTFAFAAIVFEHLQQYVVSRFYDIFEHVYYTWSCYIFEYVHLTW